MGEFNQEQWSRVERYSSAFKEEKVYATSGKKRASVRKETDPVSVTRPKIVLCKQNTAATPSEPTVSRGRSVSMKRSIHGKSNHGSIVRQPCRYYLRGTCTRTSCEYWHPPECQVYKNETGCKAWGKSLLLHYKVDEQPNKKPKKSYFPKRRESDDKIAVAMVKSVPQLGCVSQDSDALVSQGRKFWETRCRKSWNQFKGYDSQSLRYVKRVSGKRKDHRLEK